MTTFRLDDMGLIKPTVATKTNNNYWSNSKQEWLEVSEMNEQHVRNALQKLLNEVGSTYKQFAYRHEDDQGINDIKSIVADLARRLEDL